MSKKLIVSILIISSIVLILLIFNFFNKKIDKNFNKNVEKIENNKNNKNNKNKDNDEEKKFNSNLIKNVEYSTEDLNGNKYKLSAEEGEIDIKDNSIIFLKNVNAIILMSDKSEIVILSDYAKYNIINFDTIFSKNVQINYQENNISSHYLDFSIERNSLIITKNVIYRDETKILKTDVIEMNLKSKDTKFYMHNQNDKVSIKEIK